MKFSNVRNSEDVKEILDEIAINYNLKTEKIKITQAVGRVLARDIIVNVNVPEFDRSTVDGYALKGVETDFATLKNPVKMKIVGTVQMGKMFEEKVFAMEAVYVPTGGMIPIGCDAMVMIEDTKVENNQVFIYKKMEKSSHIVYKGEDLKLGDIALKKYKKIKTNDIGVLAALGICEVEVLKMPKITIISTGDEIVDIDQPMKIGQIRDVNRYVLISMVAELGGVCDNHFIINDNYENLKNAIKNSVETSDIVFLSGGSSVGNRDFTYDVINELGDIFVHGVSIKPGKPTIIGKINEKMVVGLPGHPMSSIVIFKIFFEKFILDLLKQKKIQTHTKAVLERDAYAAFGRETYQMVELIKENDNYIAKPIYSKSGFISTLSKADGYFVIEKDVEKADMGSSVDIISLY